MLSHTEALKFRFSIFGLEKISFQSFILPICDVAVEYRKSFSFEVPLLHAGGRRADN